MNDHELRGSKQHKCVLFKGQKSERGQWDWLLLESLRGEGLPTLID